MAGEQIDHSAAALNASCDAVVDLIGASGKIAYKNSGGTTFCELSLNATAFGAAGAGGTNGVAAMNASPAPSGVSSQAADLSAAAGTAEFQTSGGVKVFSVPLVGPTLGPTTDNDIVLDADSITSGATLTLDSFSYTVPDPSPAS